MKRVINKEELRAEWHLTGWGDKTALVVGYIVIGWLALCFSIGVIVGIAQSIN